VTPGRGARAGRAPELDMGVADVLAWLEREGTQQTVDGMARYGIPSDGAFGVPVGTLKALGKRLGKRHDLAADLWASGRYEARILASFVDDPAQVTRAQMEAWAADFDNWAVCDSVCFHLFDRTPLAWEVAVPWARSPREFVKRAGFVLMACLVAHDDAAPDAAFLAFLPEIEAGAGDERNFVKKGVSWALRHIGRRSPALHGAALDVARRLAASESPPARWVGKDAARELTKQAARTKERSA
jgi:3-methyladenine DNA glycosylase AlkD